MSGQRRFRRGLVAAALVGSLAACSDGGGSGAPTTVPSSTTPASATTTASTLKVPDRLVVPDGGDPQDVLRQIVREMRSGPMETGRLSDQDLVTMALAMCQFFDGDAPPPDQQNLAIARFMASSILFQQYAGDPSDGPLLILFGQWLRGADASTPAGDLVASVNEMGFSSVRHVCPERLAQIDADLQSSVTTTTP